MPEFFGRVGGEWNALYAKVMEEQLARAVVVEDCHTAARVDERGEGHDIVNVEWFLGVEQNQSVIGRQLCKVDARCRDDVRSDLGPCELDEIGASLPVAFVSVERFRMGAPSDEEQRWEQNPTMRGGPPRPFAR